MSFSAVGGQAGGNMDAVSDTATQAFAGNVTAGNLIAIGGYGVGGQTGVSFVAGDCAATAGTATLGTIRLAVQNSVDVGAPFTAVPVAVWYAKVTGTGSLTMEVTNPHTSDQTTGIAIDEATSSLGEVDDDALEDTATGGSATDDATAPATGTATSADDAFFFGVIGTLSFSPFAVTPGGAFTEVSEDDFDVGGGGGYVIYNAERRIVTTGTTDAADWTMGTSSAGFSAVLAVFREAAATVVPGQPFMGPFGGPLVGPLG